MAAHALLSPSSAHRWLVCTPSARLTELMPEPKRKGGFDHAMNGTTAHEYAEAQLRRHFKQISAAEYVEIVNRIKSTEFYTDEFEEYVAQYVLYVRSQIGTNDEPHFEIRVDYSDWVPGGSGTSDVIIIREDAIVVIDAKFGVMQVDAEENAQMRLYALGTHKKFKESHPHIKKIVCTIMQPRISNISTEEITVESLLSWADNVVKPAAKLADKGEGPFVPGNHCTFCKAKSSCRARSEFSTIEAAKDFKAPALLTEQELLEVLKKANQTKKWISDVEEHLLKRAVDGDVPAGFTLGYTSTKRKIDDEDRVKMLLFRQGFQAEDIVEPPRLKSVAQLEKVVGKEKLIGLLGDLIVKPKGSAKLVEFTAPSDFGDFG